MYIGRILKVLFIGFICLALFSGVVAYLVLGKMGGHAPRGIQVDGSQSANVETEKNQPKPVVQEGAPYLVDQSRFALIPIYQSNPRSQQYGLKSLSYFANHTVQGKSYYIPSNFMNCGNCQYLNIAFTDLKKGTTGLLLDKKALITAIFVREDLKDEKNKSKPFLIYTVVDADYNGDNFLSDEDGGTSFIANIDGTNPVALTPANTRLMSWDFDPMTKKVFLQVKLDKNSDKKFDEQDPIKNLFASSEKPSLGQDLLESSSQEKIRSLYP